jgi:hypothetical protein
MACAYSRDTNQARLGIPNAIAAKPKQPKERPMKTASLCCVLLAGCAYGTEVPTAVIETSDAGHVHEASDAGHTPAPIPTIAPDPFKPIDAGCSPQPQAEACRSFDCGSVWNCNAYVDCGSCGNGTCMNNVCVSTDAGCDPNSDAQCATAAGACISCGDIAAYSLGWYRCMSLSETCQGSNEWLYLHQPNQACESFCAATMYICDAACFDNPAAEVATPECLGACAAANQNCSTSCTR